MVPRDQLDSSNDAIRFATDKAESLGRFAWSRIARLGLPLLFGLYVWVMPQAYYEVRQSGEFTGSLVAFYPDYVSLEQSFSTITPTWNHLWYLAYVLVYILIALAILPWLQRVPESRAWQWLTTRPLVVVFILIFLLGFFEAKDARFWHSVSDSSIARVRFCATQRAQFFVITCYTRQSQLSPATT